MTDEVLDFPRGRLSKGPGDLHQITDIELRRSRGLKNVPTLRDPSAGLAEGDHSNELSFTGVLDWNGFERDYDEDFRKGNTVQFRLKVPGATYVIVGKIDDLTIKSNTGGAIEFSAKVIGKIT